MAITLRGLLDTSRLHLSLVVQGRAGVVDEPVSWVHSTELDDPTPYLEGGEVILLSGVSMSQESPSAAQRLYAQRLADRQVRGLGFGVGVVHQAPPRWLQDQCEASGLPLFTVPLQTSFMAVSKAVSRGLLDAGEQAFAARYHDQQQLLRATQTLNPAGTIVSRLAELIGGWAALLNPAGGVMESSHYFLPVPVASLGEALTFTALGQARFLQTKGYDVAVFPIPSPSGARLGFLVAGHHGPVGSLDHPLVAVGASLLSLAVTPAADANRALSSLRSSMIRQCLEGHAQDVRPYARDLWSDLPPQPLVVLRISGGREALESAERLMEPFHRTLAKNTHPVLFGVVEGDLWVVVSQSSAAVWTGQLSRDQRLSVGESSPCIWGDLPRARHEAYQACMQALTSRSSLVRYGSGEGAHELESLVDPARMRAFADLRLAPIADMRFTTSVGPHAGGAGEEEREASGGTAIRITGTRGAKTGGAGAAATATAPPTLSAVDVLRIWLESGRSMETAATRLGIHRHTVGRYLRKVGEALAVDLSDPQTLAELWYACRFTRFGNGKGGSGER